MTRPTVTRPLNPGEVFLGSNRYRLVPGSTVQRTKMTQPAPATRTGPATHADDQIASSVIWSDLTGGIGVINMDEQQSPDRFSESSAYTMTRSYLTLPSKVHSVTVPAALTGTNALTTISGAVTHRGYTYLSWGLVFLRVGNLTAPTLEYYDTVATAWATSGGTAFTYSSDGTADPVVFKGNVWIPCGSALYRYNVSAQTISAVTNASGGAAIPAQRLTVFDEDLYILQSDGAIYSTDTDGVSVTLVSRGAVDTFTYLNGLVVHKNAAGDPAPWITTESRVLAHDYFAGKVYPVGIEFSDKNAYNGTGLCTWDGDVFFGKGANVHQVTSGSRVVRGPNTGDGLPSTVQGYVTDFDASLDNYLVYAMAGNRTFGLSRVMAYNRRGHHVLATNSSGASAGASDAFTRADSAVTISDASHVWTVVAGTWGIASNQGYCAVSAGAANNVVTTGNSLSGNTTGYSYSVQVTLATNPVGTQVVFRSNGSTSYHAIETYSAGYRLVEYTAGTRAILQSAPTTTANGDVLIVQAYGPTYRVYVNGNPVLSGSLSYYPRKYVGLGTNGVTTPRFDNFTVTQIVEPTTFVHVHASAAPDVPSLLYFNGGANSSTSATQLQYIQVFDSTDNPSQFVSTDFESSGSITLPWFDADLADVQKTLVNVQIRTLGCTANQTVAVTAYMDDSASGVAMQDASGNLTITTNGLTRLYYDADRLGTKFYNLRLKISFASNSSTLAPAAVFVKIRYLREFDVLYSYTFDLDLTQNQPDDVTPAAAIATLDTLVESKLLTQFAHHSGRSDDTKDVLITTYAGPTGAANAWGGRARVTVLEVEPQ